MDNQPTQQTVASLAQQLVNVRIEVKRLEERASELRAALLQTGAPSTISCLGGQVIIVGESQVPQLDTERLFQVLFEYRSISRDEAIAVLAASKVEKPRDRYVTVRLQADGA